MSQLRSNSYGILRVIRDATLPLCIVVPLKRRSRQHLPCALSVKYVTDICVRLEGLTIMTSGWLAGLPMTQFHRGNNLFPDCLLATVPFVHLG